MTQPSVNCLDCGESTRDLKEFYFIDTELWLSVVESIYGYMCIGCLESRLGRKLNRHDFTDAYINKPAAIRDRSTRLLDRLTREG